MSTFNFNSYRDYLRDFISSLPKDGRGELSKIAHHLRINTTLLSQIMAGTRDFNLDQAFELSQYLGHSEVEAEYFYLLVEKERVATKTLKNHLEKKLHNLRNESLKLSKRIKSEKSLSEKNRSIFYSSWLYSAVHLFTSTHKDGVSLEKISERFGISRQRTKEIINFLVEASLCFEKSGHYFMGTQSTFVEKGSPHLLKHHSNWRIKAIQKSDSLSEAELMYTGQVSLSREDFSKLREKLAEFLKQAMVVVKESPAEDIACLNIDWFWLDK